MRWSAPCAVLGVATFLLGCPNPSTYGTPRTIPAGKGQHTVAPEIIYVRSKVPTVDPSGATVKAFQSDGAPMLPTYQYRRGLTDAVDFGVRLTNGTGIGADLKWNFVRSTVDLAIDPGLQWVYVPNDEGFHVFYFHAPLLAGLNVSERVALVVTVGMVMPRITGGERPFGQYAIVKGGRALDGLLGRLSAGINVRVGKTALMPEVTVMRTFDGTQGLALVGGLGIKLGAQPPTKSESLPKSPPEPLAVAPSLPEPSPLPPAPPAEGPADAP